MSSVVQRISIEVIYAFCAHDKIMQIKAAHFSVGDVTVFYITFATDVPLKFGDQGGVLVINQNALAVL